MYYSEQSIMDQQHHHNHHHHPTSTGNLRVAFWLNTGFAILELIGGLYTNSVAILSDALHDFGDSLSLGLAHYFEKKSTKRRDQFFSYGYKRFSLLGAFINSVVLIMGSVFVIQEALKRISKPEHPDAKGMLVLAIIGVAVNALAMLRLRKGNSVNEKVVSLHFLEDVLGWVAVLIGSIVMMFVDVPILDPLLSILIAGFILFNVYKNLRYSFRIILQGIPADVNIEEIRKKILTIPGITGVHDMHTWTLDGQYNIMTIHVVLKQQTSMEDTIKIKEEVRHCLEHLNIQHLTIETELENQVCELKDC